MIPESGQLSPREAGKLVGYSGSAITRWIEEGTKLRRGGRLKLQAIRYPGCWRTTEAWIQEYLDELTVDRKKKPALPIDKERAKRANDSLKAEGW